MVVVPEKLEAVTAPAKVAERSVLIVSAVVPLDCNANTPLVSAVDFRPDEPETTPLSALIVLAMCYSDLGYFALTA